MKKLSILLLGSALLIGGCSGGSDTQSPQAKAPASTPASETPIQMTQTKPKNSKPMDLLWEDLMPEGEEALLADMYTEYYKELEARIMAGQQTLSEAAKAEVESGTFDISAIAEGAANDEMEQLGTFNVVSSLNGMKIRIPGYVVPLDFNAESKYKEFLLVPYFGACLHTPPPPPNQIIFVTSKDGVEVPNIQEPYWLEGVMSTGEFSSDLADTAYEVALTDLEKYDY